MLGALTAVASLLAPAQSRGDATQSGSTPAVAVNPGNGHRYAFWRGADGHIYETWFYGIWRGPRKMSWIAAASPSVAVTASDHQYVFWQGTDGRIYEAWYYGRWRGPREMSWSANSAPGVAAPAVGATYASHQYVFWQGTNGHLYEAWYYSSWSGPRDLTASNGWGRSPALAAAPGVAINPSNDHQYVFWRGGDGHLYEVWRYNGWRGPRRMSWTAAAAPGAGVSSAGEQHAFWVGADGHIYSASYFTGWSAPIDSGWRLGPGVASWPEVEVVQSTANLAQRLTPLAPLRFGGSSPSGVNVITVDDRTRYQRISGVGGAMTDSAAWLIETQLPAAARSALISDLFGVGGAHFSYTLVPMGASDFTKDGRPYTYDDMPTGMSDPQLAHFSIAHDRSYILPALREMLATNPGTTVFAVPWTAPPWMKANRAYDNIGYHGTLLSSAYGPLAQYFVKFVKAYGTEGVPIAAVAPQNEPEAPAPYPGMTLSPSAEAGWIDQNLKPALQQARLSPSIYGGDVAWGSSGYQSTLVSTPARSDLNGLAWHCYSGLPNVMSSLHAQAPSLDHAVVECAKEIQPFPVPVLAIGAMRNWASAVLLWNLALNPAGGPVQAPNRGCGGCAGIVTIDPRSGSVRFNLAYYQLGQVGRFVQPGAYRIASNNFVTYYTNGTKPAVTAGLDDAAFENPDGTRVLVVYNTASTTIGFAVSFGGHAFRYSLPAAATVTFTWNPPS